MHFKLYEGYVKETNNLTERITEFIKDGNVDQDEMPAYSELTRRLGLNTTAWSCMSITSTTCRAVAARAIRQSSAFAKAAKTSFGSYEIWKADFVGIGKMRGVGWAICYQNPATADSQTTGSRCMKPERRRLHTDSGDGRLGACIPARLQTSRASEIHRGFLLQHRLDAVDERLKKLTGVQSARPSRLT
jgi:hypothetical protein